MSTAVCIEGTDKCCDCSLVNHTGTISASLPPSSTLHNMSILEKEQQLDLLKAMSLYTIARIHLSRSKIQNSMYHHSVHPTKPASSLQPPAPSKPHPTNGQVQRGTHREPHARAAPQSGSQPRWPHARQNFYPGADWRRKCAVCLGNRETGHGKGCKGKGCSEPHVSTAVTAFAEAYVCMRGT
jgi:hypothetical protein